jgi:type IV secretory pathway TraG/TraD family ATPase VirD4
MKNPNTPYLSLAFERYAKSIWGTAFEISLLLFLIGGLAIPSLMGMIVDQPIKSAELVQKIALWAALVPPIVATIAPAFWRRSHAAMTKNRRFKNRQKKFGAGGSAVFAEPVDEWDNEYKPGEILLGRSIHGGILLGSTHDMGLITVASSRSGKGVGIIIPNLLTWAGSAIVIDPKGTNAAVTMRRRKEMGQTVHVVDPFGVVAGAKSAAFNPLDMIDVNALTVREDIGMVVDALVVPDTGSSSAHWEESARVILAGMIAHLCATKPGATLLDLRAVLRSDKEALNTFFGGMINGGPVAEAGAALIEQAGPNERGSMMTTVMRHTSWLDSAAIAPALSRSDFRFADVKNGPVTVFAVLPPHMLQEHARFLRLFVNLMVRAASIGGKAKLPVLLLLDEFYALGRLDALAKASGALASYNLRLWPFLQNLTQVKELYRDNWQTFFANAGTAQFFGVNDRDTADEVTARMGRAAWMMDMGKGQQQRVISNLLESAELEQITSRRGGLHLIIHAGEPPIIAKRLTYFKDDEFAGMWDTDPDFKT